MFKYKYTLNKNNYEEFNGYLAIHDNALKKKMLLLMAPQCVAVTVICRIVSKSWLITIFGGLVFALIMIVFFPKIYWKDVFNRIKKINSKMNYQFSETNVEFTNDEVLVESNGNSINIEYSNIIALDMTKDLLLLFYKKESNGNIIIPIEVIGDELTKLNEYIYERTDRQ